MNTKRNIFLVHLLLVFVASISESQSVEYSVKASLIEKFARYTEWEANSIGESFVIGILGTSPFKGEFERLAAKGSIKNKRIAIRYLKDYREAKVCHVLFISQSEHENVKEIVNYLKTMNVLLVADSQGFSENGVHFNFYLKDDGTIHFEVNPKALNIAKLRTDMLLLSIGKVVE